MRWQQVLFYSAKDLEKDELDITYDICTVCVSVYVERHACQKRKEGHSNCKHIDFCSSHMISGPFYIL